MQIDVYLMVYLGVRGQYVGEIAKPTNLRRQIQNPFTGLPGPVPGPRGFNDLIARRIFFWNFWNFI